MMPLASDTRLTHRLERTVDGGGRVDHEDVARRKEMWQVDKSSVRRTTVAHARNNEAYAVACEPPRLGWLVRYQLSGSWKSRLAPDRAPTGRDWSRLSKTWTSRIDERIAELERLRAGLTQCIGCGCLSLDRCQLSNPADRAARLGPGARYWIGDRPPR